MDLPLPPAAGVVSLMNSSPACNCRKDVIENIDRPLLMLDGTPVTRVPTVVASTDIAPRTELFWDYVVKHDPMEDEIDRKATLSRLRSVFKLFLLAHRFERGCPHGVLDHDVLRTILAQVAAPFPFFSTLLSNK